jgi:cytochrome c-type biogenesis protein CcmH
VIRSAVLASARALALLAAATAPALPAATAPALLAPADALAQDCPRTTLGDIEDEVMCPICGTPLGLASEAPQAQQQRAFIEEQIADCRSKEEIKRALVAQFGEGVLALPGDESGDDDAGDVLVYAIPAAAILLALGGVGFAVARWRGARDDEGGRPRRGDPAVAGSDTARLEADLERYDL